MKNSMRTSSVKSLCWTMPIVLSLCACAGNRAIEGTVASQIELNEPNDQAKHDVGQRIADIAARYEGVKYSYGGADPNGFDCSGLVYYVHRLAGISLPRTARQQYGIAPNQQNRPRPGDVAFFSSSRGVDHVGIMVSENEFIHAPKAGREVEYRSLNEPYWRDRLQLVAPLHSPD